jgi:membrane-bound inhibitor of C-type lysozyme
MRWLLASLTLIVSMTTAFATQASYRCADGTAIKAIFSPAGPAGSMRLTFAGQRRPLELPQAPSADGGRYADGSIEFWIRGSAAQLTRAGVATECKTNQ